MTPTQVRWVLRHYRARLGNLVGPQRYQEGGASPDARPLDARQAAHILWMCSEVDRFLDAGRVEKAMRWLGFIQGVMWSQGLSTIEELRADNRIGLVEVHHYVLKGIHRAQDEDEAVGVDTTATSWALYVAENELQVVHPYGRYRYLRYEDLPSALDNNGYPNPDGRYKLLGPIVLAGDAAYVEVPLSQRESQTIWDRLERKDNG